MKRTDGPKPECDRAVELWIRYDSCHQFEVSTVCLLSCRAITVFAMMDRVLDDANVAAAFSLSLSVS